MSTSIRWPRNGAVLTMGAAVPVSATTVKNFKKLYNSTAGNLAVTYIEPSGSTVTAFPLAPGWHDICGTSITLGAFTLGDIWAPEEISQLQN